MNTIFNPWIGRNINEDPRARGFNPLRIERVKLLADLVPGGISYGHLMSYDQDGTNFALAENDDTSAVQVIDAGKQITGTVATGSIIPCWQPADAFDGHFEPWGNFGIGRLSGYLENYGAAGAYPHVTAYASYSQWPVTDPLWGAVNAATGNIEIYQGGLYLGFAQVNVTAKAIHDFTTDSNADTIVGWYFSISGGGAGFADDALNNFVGNAVYGTCQRWVENITVSVIGGVGTIHLPDLMAWNDVYWSASQGVICGVFRPNNPTTAAPSIISFGLSDQLGGAVTDVESGAVGSFEIIKLG